MNYQGMFIGSLYLLGTVIVVSLAVIIVNATVKEITKGKDKKKKG